MLFFSAAYGEEAKTSSLLAQLKKIAPPVLGAASAAAIGVLAKAKVRALMMMTR